MEWGRPLRANCLGIAGTSPFFHRWQCPRNTTISLGRRVTFAYGDILRIRRRLQSIRKQAEYGRFVQNIVLFRRMIDLVNKQHPSLLYVPSERKSTACSNWLAENYYELKPMLHYIAIKTECAFISLKKSSLHPKPNKSHWIFMPKTSDVCSNMCLYMIRNSHKNVEIRAKYGTLVGGLRTRDYALRKLNCYPVNEGDLGSTNRNRIQLKLQTHEASSRPTWSCEFCSYLSISAAVFDSTEHHEE